MEIIFVLMEYRSDNWLHQTEQFLLRIQKLVKRYIKGNCIKNNARFIYKSANKNVGSLNFPLSDLSNIFSSFQFYFAYILDILCHIAKSSMFIFINMSLQSLFTLYKNTQLSKVIAGVMVRGKCCLKLADRSILQK